MGDSFGHSVSIDGDYTIVGEPRDDDKGGLSDSVYVLDYVKLQIDPSVLVAGETENKSGTMTISKK